MPRPARQAITAAVRLPITASAPTPCTVRRSGRCRQMKKPITAAVASSTIAKAALAYFSLRLAEVTGGPIARSAPDISRRLQTRPHYLDLTDPEAAHRGHGLGNGRENWRVAPQQLPVLAPQHLPQIIDVAVDGLHVGIAAAIEALEVPVGGAELPVQALLPHLRYEVRRLAQQVEARGVLHLAPPIGGDGQRHPAEDELRIQPVAALLE